MVERWRCDASQEQASHQLLTSWQWRFPFTVPATSPFLLLEPPILSGLLDLFAILTRGSSLFLLCSALFFCLSSSTSGAAPCPLLSLSSYPLFAIFFFYFTAIGRGILSLVLFASFLPDGFLFCSSFYKAQSNGHRLFLHSREDEGMR